MQSQDRLPQTVGGYRIVRRLAREATVDVLLAATETRGQQERQVVLKLVSPTFRGDATFEQTFARETQALAQLDHPNVVRLFDVFSAPDIKAMVLEHVEGLTLAELRAALIARGDSLPDVAVYAVASSLFAAVAAAHASRDPTTGNLLPLVHRDIHPAQVMIAHDGTVKLGGFGLERITGVRGDARTSEARGYLPPEKARGEAVTTRSDVYATMLIVWELLARRRAIRDDALPEQELARALAQPTLVSLEVLRPEVPALVRSIVSRGLEPLVERRTVTAEEAASIFRSAAPGDEGRSALAKAVARASTTAPASPAPPPVREPSLPSFPLSETPPPVAAADKRGPPRPSPRRMWNSSPTLTPAGGSIVNPPSSRMGSIPDARFSQEPDRQSVIPTAPARPPSERPPPPSRPLPPSHRGLPPISTRTHAGGFDVGALNPLIKTPPPATPAPATAPGIAPTPSPVSARPPPPPPSGRPPASAPPPFPPAPQTAPLPYAPPTPAEGLAFAQTQYGNMEAVREPAASLPGMGVPLLAAPPGAPAIAPPPPPPGETPFWSAPPPAPPGVSPIDVPTTPPRKARSRRTSMAGLALGLFFVAVALGAGGFIALFRKSPPPATSASLGTPPASAVAKPPAAPASATAPATATTTTPTATTTATVAPTPTPVKSVAPAPSAPAPPVAKTPPPTAESASGGGTTGTLRVDKKAAGHRIFFDGRVIGEGEGPFTVACGKHTVKVGSRGKPQKIDVPCGGEINVAK